MLYQPLRRILQIQLAISKAAAFDEVCAQYGIIYYLIDPGKPQRNCFVERSHREDQEKFYEQNRFASFKDLRYKLKIWNRNYNNACHCGLNELTPN